MKEPAVVHPDADTLCDLDAGLLKDTAGEADLQAHVAGCASCADLLALLATTRERLAALPQEPMPVDVATRMDAALAAAAAQTVTPRPATVAAVPSLRSPRRSSGIRWLRGVGAVAAGAALLMAGGIGVRALGGPSDRSPLAGVTEGRSAPATGSPPAISEVRNYTPATLADGVRALLPGRAADGAVRQSNPSAAPLPLGTRQTAAESAALARLRAPAQLAACVAELAGKQGVTPLAVDFALFQAEPAVVIVLPTADPTRVAAWVVGPACMKGHADRRHDELVSRAG